MPADQPPEFGSLEWEAAFVRRRADIHERNGETEAAEMLRSVADELASINAFQAPPGAEGVAVTNDGFVPPFQVRRGHDPFGKTTVEPGTTDQRQAVSDFLTHLDFEDTIGTDTVALFALLRDVADAEPVAHLSFSNEGLECTMCGADAESGPVTHLISCPWVRVTQVVGTALPEATAGG